MDPKKRLKLVEVGYSFPPACWRCSNASFRKGSDFGTCGAHEYDHEKHTENPRQLSIHRGGSCSSFEPGDDGLPAEWAEFLA